MPDARRDREQLQRLLTGEFGESTDLYGNIALQNKVGERNVIQAVFGFYADPPNLRFYDFHETHVGARWFLERIPGYAFTNDHRQILGEQQALLEESHPDWRDADVSAWLWRTTQQRFSKLGLPVTFFSYQTTADGSENVVFWYPRLVFAEGALKMFKLAISDVRPR